VANVLAVLAVFLLKHWPATCGLGTKFGLGILLGYCKTLCRIGDIGCLIRGICR
jgi:hypothetical protein